MNRDEIRARWADRPTEPWTTKPWGNTEPPSVVLIIPEFGHTIMPVELADAIAYAPTDIAYLLDALDAAEGELAAWHAECDKVHVPHDPEGLVRHHRHNAGFAAAINADLKARINAEVREESLRAALTNVMTLIDTDPMWRASAFAKNAREALAAQPIESQ